MENFHPALCVGLCDSDRVCIIHFPDFHGNYFEFFNLSQKSATVLSRQGGVRISQFPFCTNLVASVGVREALSLKCMLVCSVFSFSRVCLFLRCAGCSIFSQSIFLQPANGFENKIGKIWVRLRSIKCVVS